MGYLKRHRGEKHTLLESTWVLAAFGILAIVMLVQAVLSYRTERRALRDHQARAEEIKQKEELKKELEKKLQKLQSGEGMEMEARGRLNLQKPDEHVLIVLDNSPASATTTEVKRASLWEGLLELFSWQ